MTADPDRAPVPAPARYLTAARRRPATRPAALLTALLATALTAVFALGGCGGADSADSTTADANSSAGAATFPVTVTGSNGDVSVPAMPKRIISLSPTATEMLFAVGAGDQVVAVDDQSNYPAEAPKSQLSGFKPNAEAVIGYEPDLVVMADDANGLLAALTTVKVPVLQLTAAATLDNSYQQLDAIGTATGHAAQADEVVETMKKRIAEAVAGAKQPAGGLTYYHELDNTYFSATSKTFIGSVYSMFGLTNIADPAAKSGNEYPQLSAEFVVKADPDLVFLADTKCCQQNANSVAGRPGWSGLTVVKTKGVIELDDDVASRWGPRVADLAQTIADAVSSRG